MSRQRPIAGYPSVAAACRGLRARGLTPLEISRRLGVSQSTVSDNLAQDARRERPGPPERVRRPCLSCGKGFDSEGRHNRLCAACRVRGADLAFAPGGSAGRRVPALGSGF